MISNSTWPRVMRSANRTCDCRHVLSGGGGDDSSGGGGGSLLRIVALTLCCVTATCGDPKDRTTFGFKDLQLAMNKQSSFGECDLEPSCDWRWNQTKGFVLMQAPARSKFGPSTDANNSREGHFLWYSGSGTAQMWSQRIPPTSARCTLELWMHQVAMEDGAINLVIDTNNVSSVTEEKYGNNNARWENVRFFLGTISQPYRLFLEILLPYANSSVAVDNVRLVNCFPDPTLSKVVCTDDMFRCKNGTCLSSIRICDFIKDCPDGEDETYECEKIPENARCNFENGWCGWSNVPGRPLNWTLRSSFPQERIAPAYDHTYRNRTGMYAYVEMSKRVPYGSRATIESSLYNPTPPYSSDSKNPYYQSCQIRFFYHKYGLHSTSLALYVVQMKRHGNQTNILWWSYGKGNKEWESAVIPLPDIRYRYFLQFEASRGYSSKNDIAIDDVSLSRECFGIGVPADIVGDFNYYNPNIDLETVPPQHPDFVNETVIRVTTCGATGRTGPTSEQCADEYNGTGMELMVPALLPSDQEVTPAHNLSGMQRWTAPRGEYYTLIVVGARGGMGSGGMGSTFGALVRGVIELQKGDQLYFMVGQEGTNACAKSLGMRETCRSPDESHGSSVSSSTSAKVREVKKVVFKYGGGGGGGATAVFMLKPNGDLEPIIIAGGGGGLGSGQFKDDGLQHGRGPVPGGRFLPSSYESDEGAGGAGGSWYGQWTNDSDRQGAAGVPLIRGGLGGLGCETGEQGHSNGGFGGGGGGCQTGGGGGGYIGGNTGRSPSGNGEGGFSFISQRLTDIYFKAAAHHGSGEIYIIPAISGCSCDYRCVVLDQYLSETKCLCPQGWLLSNDSKSCVTDESKGVHSTYMIPLIVVSSLLVILGIGLILYFSLNKRFQCKKALLHRRQMILGNGTELTALRVMSGTLITEFNPNYEFAGNLYSFKDLPQIPRECISLTRPLGQGAFGEVHEGQYKYRRGQHPVAVKTLLTLSTPQAEADFMMEALIMSKFNHTNIVHFIGVCFDKHPKYIVLELLAGGDLKNFLREERPRRDRSTTLTMRDLVMCSFDVANGCKYMEETRFIHRDIAARNCLLTTKGPGRIVKIADFGMARDIYRGDYYRKGAGTVLPIKWMSPESLFDGIYTTKSDVWSFGVLLWEIMSFGYTPYIGCGNHEVITMVKTGGRLEKPVGCPDPIYGIMMKCWRPQADRRPSFSNIVERIGYCLQDPDVVCEPTPKYDVLPTDEGEMTMWPDPEAECINMQSDLDGCGYVRPRVIDPRSVAHHMNQVVGGGTTYDAETDKSNRSSESRCRAFAKSTECQQEKFGCNAYDSIANTFERSYTGDDREDKIAAGDCKGRHHQADPTNRPDPRTIHRSENIEERDNRINEENGNNRPEEECRLTANTDSVTTDRRNGNESTTTTDTNSDSLIVQSSDTPPNTATNSSPNTRTCSPSRVIGLNYANVNNANGVTKKNTLKATLSLDPSALYRGAIPYEKITRHTQRSSTPGSMELRKDSLSHELPREEECSC